MRKTLCLAGRVAGHEGFVHKSDIPSLKMIPLSEFTQNLRSENTVHDFYPRVADEVSNRTDLKYLFTSDLNTQHLV